MNLNSFCSGIASAVQGRVICATCGKSPAVKTWIAEWDRSLHFYYRCHGAIEEKVLEEEMMVGALSGGSQRLWPFLLRPFWPGFSKTAAVAPNKHRRALWRERRAAARGRRR